MHDDPIDKRVGFVKNKLVLELTYACNSACHHCCANSYLPSKDIQVMDFDVAKATINQAKESGIDYLLISGGEPTLVDYLPELVEHGNNKDMEIRINTNGSKSDIEYWQNLKDKGLDYVVISIDTYHNDPRTNPKHIPIEKVFYTLGNLIKLGVGTTVPFYSFKDYSKKGIEIMAYLLALHKHFGKTETKNNFVKMSYNGMDHYIAHHIYNYNGRKRKILFQYKGKCPSEINLENKFTIRVTPENKIRTPCSSFEHLKINPLPFDTKDSKSLMKGIETLRKDESFKEFLREGHNKKTDTCNYCIETFLNKRII